MTKIMTKFLNLGEKEKENIENELESKAIRLGLKFWSNDRHGDLLKDKIGLCSNCKDFTYCKTEFGNIYAKCSTFDIRMSGQNKITECNMFDQKGTLTLSDMYNIAIVIDIPKRTPGFLK